MSETRTNGSTTGRQEAPDRWVDVRDEEVPGDDKSEKVELVTDVAESPARCHGTRSVQTSRSVSAPWVSVLPSGGRGSGKESEDKEKI